jgi:hypothetical protein
MDTNCLRLISTLVFPLTEKEICCYHCALSNWVSQCVFVVLGMRRSLELGTASFWRISKGNDDRLCLILFTTIL